jgi:cell division protease FtsH
MTITAYNFPKPHKQPNINFDVNHLDRDNLEKLERMFYLKNSRYNPMRNRIYYKYKITNETEQASPHEVNITNVLQRINDEFMKNYREQMAEYEEDEKSLEKEFEGSLNDNNDTDKSYTTDDNRNNRNPTGYVDENGIFRYRIPRIIITTNQQIPDMAPTNENIETNGQFQIYRSTSISFKDVGGYEKIKDELMQTSDILLNYTKYKRFKVRTPKGIIFEGPPGNGKTLLAKGYCGELNISFIPVSGSEFAEKYVGVGAHRVRELFKIANENKPCIVFIDEIDALGRARGNDDNSNSEKDQTLNQLLVCLDGFKDSEGVFVIGATNRVDLLDSALTRPGRIDKNIYFGTPDSETREAIIKIHSEGKPMELEISIQDLVETTGGFSGAQIENLLNEAMLKALRENREIIKSEDLEYILNRIYAGWQNKESKFSDDIIERIVMHEIGHAIVGFLCDDHSKLSKIVLNLWSPKSPGYTIFEKNDEDSNIYTKTGLFNHLMVLLAGRIAEEVFFGYSVTTGARQDLEQAFALAKNMIVNYGMGKQNIYPDMSDHSKYLIDQEVNKLLMMANDNARIMILKSKHLMQDCAVKLKEDKLLKPEEIVSIVNSKYPEIWSLYDVKAKYTEQ